MNIFLSPTPFLLLKTSNLEASDLKMSSTSKFKIHTKMMAKNNGVKLKGKYHIKECHFKHF